MSTNIAARPGTWWPLVAAALLGIPFWVSTAVLVPPGCAASTCSWLATGDPLIALACLVLLLWRRRFPLAVAMTVTVVSTASTLAAGAALLALCSISTRRRPVEIGVVVLAFVAASQFTSSVYPIEIPPVSAWLMFVFPLLCAGIAVAVGAAVGARRVEVLSLRERAQGAEREHAARAAQARAQERNRIAREMHDVLAHRISLVAMQAGVLDHRKNLSAEEHRVLVRGIADGSQQALEELRDVLGVLRADPEAPQPAPGDVAELIADSRVSGLDVVLTDTLSGEPPEVIRRTCYRIIQEGLTNAAKHAPGAQVRVTLAGTAGDQLYIEVRNSPATKNVVAGAQLPSSGFGLLGLNERVALAGGTLTHQPTADGGHVLTARLPWSKQKHPGGD